ILLVSAGLIGLARGLDAAGRRPVLLALATGAFIAAYTTVDGVGVRRAGGAGAYAAWLFVLYGALMPACFVAVRGFRGLRRGAREIWQAAVGGNLSLAAYAIVLFALNRAPIGAVSALRETGVVFAAVLGHLFLGERLNTRRLLACVVIVIGIACIGWRN